MLVFILWELCVKNIGKLYNLNLLKEIYFITLKKKYVRVYVNTVFIYTIACFWWLCCVNIAYSVQIFKETSVRCSHKFSLYIRFHYKLNTTVSLVKKTQNVRAYAWSHRINKVNRLNLSHLFKVNFFFCLHNIIFLL